MESSFGWVELSPSALRRLRQDLESDSEGVRDEMGLLALHSGYADRFFPGSSVQHRRPRYLFFTCWNYLCLGDSGGASARLRKEEAEDWVRRRLLAAGEKGAIGARLGDARPAQPPDTVYWGALTRWGFYRGPSRGTLLARWDSIERRLVRVRAMKDDTLQIPDGIAEFHVPDPPRFWLHPKPREAVTFALTRPEAVFLQERLESLEPCILSCAARRIREAAPSGDSPWEDPLIRDMAEERDEVEVLERARRASSLATIVRAVYAALVEVRREKTMPPSRHAKLADPAHYRNGLKEILDPSAPLIEDVHKLDLALVRKDVGRLDEGLVKLLAHVRARVCNFKKAGDASGLLDAATLALFTHEEIRRKDQRARLADTVAGMERRAEFDGAGQGGLDYRWVQVRTMLRDLRDGLLKGARS